MGGVQTPATLDFNEAEYQRINTWLRNRSGMIFLDNKKESLMLRMDKVRETHSLPDLNALATALEKGQNADLETAVIHADSTNHTYFFRELSVLNYFQASILPELPITNVRIWSAAASTGDEAYSIAMIAAQTRGLDWAKKQLAILGTDISELVIAHAEKGIYGGLHVDKTPPEYLDYGFDPVGMNQYRVKQQFQQMCTFRRLNLKNTPYPFKRPFHVVFCRNVLYYFDRAQQTEVIEAIYNVTEPGGWLITSVTMSLRGLQTRWQPVEVGVYRKPL